MIKLSQKIKLFIGLGIIVLLGCCIYSNTFNSPFQFDDYEFVRQNQTIRNVRNVKAIFQGVLSQPSRFIGFLTFALNYHFHGTDVFGYHLVNFCIHILTSFIVWRLLYALYVLAFTRVSSSGEISSERMNLLAFFSALLFLVHPVQTQAVSYITQRFASLATLFYVSSLFFYVKARMITASTSKLEESQPGSVGKFFFASLICALLGMFTKEIVITLPVMMIVVELFFFDKKTRSRKYFYLFLGGLLALVLIIPAVFSFKLKSMFLVPRLSESHAGDVLTFPVYLLTQLRVWVTLGSLLFWPVNQNLDYDFVASKTLWEPETFLSFGILALCLFLAFRLRKKEKLMAFAIFWFFLTLAANLVPRRFVIFEHKLYLVSVSFCLLIPSVVGKWFKELKHAVVVMILLVGIFSWMTFQRNEVWRSPRTLWEDVVVKSPLKAGARLNLGNAYNQEGKVDLALASYNDAIRLNPAFTEAINQRALVYVQQGEEEKALKDFERILQIDERFVRAWNNQGNLYRRMRRYDLALRNYEKAIEVQPRYVDALFNRALILEEMQKFPLAIKGYTAVLKIDPTFDQALINRAGLYCFKGQVDLALVDYGRAIYYNPRADAAYFNRGQVFASQGLGVFAIKDFQKALEINPYHHRARMRLADTYYREGFLKDALDEYLPLLKTNAPQDQILERVKDIQQELHAKTEKSNQRRRERK